MGSSATSAAGGATGRGRARLAGLGLGRFVGRRAEPLLGGGGRRAGTRRRVDGQGRAAKVAGGLVERLGGLGAVVGAGAEVPDRDAQHGGLLVELGLQVGTFLGAALLGLLQLLGGLALLGVADLPALHDVPGDQHHGDQ